MAEHNGVLVSGGFDGFVKVWNLQDFSCYELGEHFGVVNKVMISDISQSGLIVIASSGSDNMVKIWSLLGLRDILEYH